MGGGQKHDRSFSRGQTLEERDAVQPRHLDVEKNDVGAKGSDRFASLDPVRALANHGKVVVSFEHRPHAFARHRFIIDDQCPNHGSSARAGIRTSATNSSASL
jgi:hypothetical protein